MSSRELECPGRKEPLAALEEGRLPPEERADLVEHLGDCEVCYEIYTELLRFSEDDERESRPTAPAPVIAHPRSVWNQPGYRWAAAAAVLVAVISVPLLRQVLGVDPASSAALTAAFTPQGLEAARLGEDWAQPPWRTLRDLGEDLSEAQSSLRLGARVVDLHLALRLGETDAGVQLASEMAVFLEPTALADRADRYVRILDRLDAEASPSDLVPAAQQAEVDLESALGEALDAREYRLGKLAEAGRLAARTGNAGFFDDRARRRLYEALLEELGANAPQELREAVERIRDQGVEASELPALEDLFEEMLRRRGSGAGG